MNRPDKTHLMPLAVKPGVWQTDVARALRRAMQDGLHASAPRSDGGAAHAPAVDAPAPATAWRCARVDIAAMSRSLSPQASMAPLYLRCLTHYRDDLRAQDVDQDDAGLALACMLASSLQALEAHAVTLPRWSHITTWLVRHVMPGLDWTRASQADQQQFFARMALLAVALGEWSLEASKRGSTAQVTARLMARQHLEGELGIEAELLLKSMRWLDVIPAA